MPGYTHLATEAVDFGETAAKLRAMRAVGVPYRPEVIQTARTTANEQARAIETELTREGGIRICAQPGGECDLVEGSRLVALIGYLQRLGRVPTPTAPVSATVAVGGAP
jgi:cbb3-type cytochrome oxidase cytochrome c subunit